jgi:predicted phage baseplate assembly protein
VLPQILLDDVRFQELVSEARTRIVRHSPDWTEHNVSDPGITLIELFAWFTEILVYRINRIPERLQFGLLELVGVRPAAPQRAEARVRFLLTEPGSGATVPLGTEVASARTAGADAVVFQTVAELVIEAGDLPVTVGTAPDDAVLVLGFERPIGGLSLRLEIESSRAEGSDIDSESPPLVWEASGVDGRWLSAEVVSDETGGFTLGGGAITVDVPDAAAPARLDGRELHWLRCRITERDAHGKRATYSTPPRAGRVEVTIAGASVAASHGATVRGELIGTSEGVPGVSHRLQRAPVLPLVEGETVEVREPGSGRWVGWQVVESFARSGPADRHFVLDTVRGEVRFGPAIRQPDGGWRRYGAIPVAGSAIRLSAYRHGGGSAGNVAPRALRILSSAVAGVASVTNPAAAAGGLDGESLQAARERGRLEIRARSRAVTAEDFEALTLAASPRVARAVCVAPAEPGPIRVHVLPALQPADRQLEYDELVPDEALMTGIAAALDEHRLLGCSVRLAPVRLRGVSVVADVRASPLADLERVQHDVEHALYVYLNPLIGGSPEGPGDGWPLGRALNQGELFGIVYGIPGVEFVNILRMYETDIRTGQQAPQPTESHLVLGPDELVASGKHIVKAIHR